MLLKPRSLQRNATEQVEPTARPQRVESRGRSYSEEVVTPEIALTVPAVTAIITLKSQDLAQIPLILYARRGRAKYRAYDNPYYRLMHDRPNPEMTSYMFRELGHAHTIAWGNFFAQKIFDREGDVAELWPLRPDRMTVERFQGERIYKYTMADGKTRIFLQEEIFHNPGFGFDGLIGYSRIHLARNVIGASISATKFGSKFFSNGLHSDLVYKHPGTLSETARKNLEESLDEKTGVEHSHEPFILEEGMDLASMGINQDDAQFLETQKFLLSDINRLVGPVPPHMIGDTEKSTSWGTGIDSQEQGYVNHGLMPDAVRFEQNLDWQILPESMQADGYYYEHLFDAFLRGDITTRHEAYVKGITNGFMSRNEVRARENMNPYKGGDEMLIPKNMDVVTDDNAAESATTATNPAENRGASALEPLWRDAAVRAVKRETNDLQGASARWLAKGQADSFNTWTESFYGKDHPAFVMKQFAPLLEAGKRLQSMDWTRELESFVQGLMDERAQAVAFMSTDEIASGAEAYRAEAVEKIMVFVKGLTKENISSRAHDALGTGQYRLDADLPAEDNYE